MFTVRVNSSMQITHFRGFPWDLHSFEPRLSHTTQLFRAILPVPSIACRCVYEALSRPIYRSTRLGIPSDCRTDRAETPKFIQGLDITPTRKQINVSWEHGFSVKRWQRLTNKPLCTNGIHTHPTCPPQVDVFPLSCRCFGVYLVSSAPLVLRVMEN